MNPRLQVATYVALVLLTPRPAQPTPWIQRRGQCGSWGPEYARLHSDVLAGRASPKYLVVEGIEGLSDSLSLVAGMLYVAMLSGRALQIRETLPWSAAYDKPNIDWRETPKDSVLNEARLTLRTGGPMPTNETAFELIYKGSLGDLGDGADIVTMFGNVGVINVLFNNPQYKSQLYRMGLGPEIAYGCALEYLFAPSLAIKQHFHEEILTMTGDALKIGIQIRLGDSYLKGGVFEDQKHAEATLETVQHFFDCANQLVTTFRQPGQQVVWLLLSDSLDIRSLTKSTYGDRVLVKLDEPSHVAGMSGNEQREGMIAAAGEHWLFGLADYHVISSIGGFGRSAALRSQGWDTIFELDVHQMRSVQCDGLHMRPLSWEQIANHAPFV
ncbi:hypothetical protein ABBQ38_000058 [Trebouxia sp. C0009 RCD-2024]